MTSIAAILSAANLGKTSAQDPLNDTQLEYLAQTIKADYPNLPVSTLKRAIDNGWKGRYSNGEFEPINGKTIYRWIEEARKEDKKWYQNLPNWNHMIHNGGLEMNRVTGEYTLTEYGRQQIEEYNKNKK